MSIPIEPELLTVDIPVEASYYMDEAGFITPVNDTVLPGSFRSSLLFERDGKKWYKLIDLESQPTSESQSTSESQTTSDEDEASKAEKYEKFHTTWEALNYRQSLYDRQNNLFNLTNIVCVLVFLVILIVIIYIIMRRQRYRRGWTPTQYSIYTLLYIAGLIFIFALLVGLMYTY